MTVPIPTPGAQRGASIGLCSARMLQVLARSMVLSIMLLVALPTHSRLAAEQSALDRAFSNLYSRHEVQITRLDTRSADGRVRSVETQILRGFLEGGPVLLLRSTHPEKTRGIAYLSAADDLGGDPAVHVYLPALGIARRLSSGSMGDPVLGTALSFEDLHYKSASDFDIVHVGNQESESCSTYTLTPKQRVRSGYSQYYVCVIDESRFGWIELFRDGSRVKRIDLDERSVREVDGRSVARSMSIRDYSRNLETVTTVQFLASGLSVPDRLLSSRNLETGSAERDLRALRSAMSSDQLFRLGRYAESSGV